MDYKDKIKKRAMLKITIACSVIIIICVALIIIKTMFTVTNIEVVGNEHYTAEEIQNLVIKNERDRNSVLLNMKYNKKRSVENIPFIERMDVKILSPNRIRIEVYEKALAGYVEYLGHYMYFDREGIVVESSSRQIEGIPYVRGLKYNYVELHEKLPVDDERIFSTILTITQLLTKYNIKTDMIYFDNNEEITLHFGEIRVFIGSNKYIDEKINELNQLIPKLPEYPGVLHMENYTGEGGKFTFEKDKTDVKVDELNVEAELEETTNEN